jgi:SOS-response transcriptional repressor LexA
MARPFSTELSTAQNKILRVIVRLQKAGLPALTRYLLEELKLAGNNSLLPTLRIMERNGFLEVFGGGERGRPQFVRLTSRGQHVTQNLCYLPLLAKIRAGPLEEIFSDPEVAYADVGDVLPWRAGD